MDKADITVDTPIPVCPEKPKAITDDDKEKQLLEIDGELKKLENRKKEIINTLQELTKKVRGKKKPDEVKEAELRRRSLIDSKKQLLDELRSLNKQFEVLKSQAVGVDDQKPDKFKRTRVLLPQDEEELDFLIHGWDELYQTRSLSKGDEDEIMKRVNDLEKLRPSLGDVNNLNKEIQQLKKRMAGIRQRTKEIKDNLTSVNAELEDCDAIVNE